MPDWIPDEQLWWGLGALSVVTFLASLLLMPILVARLPEDYFHHRRRHPEYTQVRHPLVHLSLVVLKNALGVVLLLAGIAMLVLPGQGVLTILIAIALMNFPGKFQLEKAIVRQPTVFHALNWIRARAHKPPLLPPDHE
jgi:hypothetical protein